MWEVVEVVVRGVKGGGGGGAWGLGRGWVGRDGAGQGVGVQNPAPPIIKKKKIYIIFNLISYKHIISYKYYYLLISYTKFTNTN